MQVHTPYDVAILVREQRRNAKLSQEKFAETIGVSRQWVQNLEAGKPGLELGLTLRALTALGISLDAQPKQPNSNGADTVDVPDINAIIRNHTRGL